MRVVDVAVRQCYRFNCPNCGSRLEADCGDLVDIGGKTSRFWCPVCRKGTVYSMERFKETDDI